MLGSSTAADFHDHKTTVSCVSFPSVLELQGRIQRRGQRGVAPSPLLDSQLLKFLLWLSVNKRLLT